MRVYFTMGIPCSGKSAWSEKLIAEKGNTINFSRTSFRNAMLKRSGKDFYEISKDVRADVDAVVDEIAKLLPTFCKMDVVFDNTNLVWKNLTSNAAHYYNNGWDVTFVVFPIENVVIKYPSQEKLLGYYSALFSEKQKSYFDNFIDAYSIEVIYITNEEQRELLSNEPPKKLELEW
jgi:hypothetical protein